MQVPSMPLSDWLISASWLVFVAYWAVTAVGAKKSIRTRPWGEGAGWRAAVILLLLLGSRFPVLRQGLGHLQAYMARAGMVLGLAGAVLCILGIGLAIWARVYLGRNWGMPMSRKADPELVTGGPYAYVRHPIYTGLLMAMLGSAIGSSVGWIIPLVIGGVYFVYSARNEERLMLEQFPEQYPAYMKRTKMLLPFIV